MNLMRAVVVHSFEPFMASLEQRKIPLPQPDEVRINMHAAGVSFVDALTARGQYQTKPQLPYVPGSECAGIVDMVGAEVDDFQPGDRVCVLSGGGIYADWLCVKASAATRLPPGMPFSHGAVIRVAHSTALYALAQRGQLAAGESLLVLGAGGAVGQAATEIGKALGAFVIAAASSPEKREAARGAGADATIGSAAAVLRDELKRALDGRALDLVFDPVGGAVSEVAFRSLGWNGRYLVAGFASGAIPALKTNLALLKGASLIGVNVGMFNGRQAETAAANLQQIFMLYINGRIRPKIAHCFSLEDYSLAFDLAASGTMIGRIMFDCGTGGV